MYIQDNKSVSLDRYSQYDQYKQDNKFYLGQIFTVRPEDKTIKGIADFKRSQESSGRKKNF